MNNKITLKELAIFFWSIEKEFDLLNYSVNGIKIWQYYRFRIFNTLALKCKIYTEAHTKKKSFSQLFKAFPSLLYYSLFSNPLRKKYKKKILLFNSGRKFLIDNKYVDIYFDYFINNSEPTDYEIIDELYENKHSPTEYKNIKHQDYQQITTFLKSKLSRFSFNNDQKAFISKIEQKICSKLNIEIKLESLLRNGYLLFKFDYQFFNKLIKKREPGKIYINCSYTYKKALVAAAKNNRVECIEFQHGTITKYHMGYSYPGSDYIDYFPDKILVFGQFWKDALSYPVPPQNIVTVGFPHFNNQKGKYKNLEKIEDQILILSQGAIGFKLSKLIYEGAEFLKNYKIIYKLHPGEYSRWKDEYPHLEQLNKMGNIKVIDHNNENLYSLFAKSAYIFGIFSTAVYEALGFGCKVILFDLPGIEYMSDIIQNKNAKIAANVEEAIKHIELDDISKFKSDYFFEENFNGNIWEL